MGLLACVKSRARLTGAGGKISSCVAHAYRAGAAIPFTAERRWASNACTKGLMGELRHMASISERGCVPRSGLNVKRGKPTRSSAAGTSATPWPRETREITDSQCRTSCRTSGAKPHARHIS